MSGKFLASNGIPVTLTDNGRLIVANSDHTYPATIAAGEHVEALREFFRAEEDERLGRWRWPANPNWVCYASDEDRGVVVFDEDNPYLGTVTLDRGGDTWPHWRPAAEAYFDAHPVPKPWHAAKPGEVWVIVTRNVGEERAVQVHGDQFHYNDGFEYPLTYNAIESGRRIWPEVAS